MKHFFEICFLFILISASSCYPWHNDLFPDISYDLPDFRYNAADIYFNKDELSLSPDLSGTLPEGVLWEITSGSLPGGLALDSGTGEISGTVDEDGSFIYADYSVSVKASWQEYSKEESVFFHVCLGSMDENTLVFSDDVTLNAEDSLPSAAENISVEAGGILTINGPGTVTVFERTSVTLKNGAEIQLKNGASIAPESQQRITSEISSETGLSAFAGMVASLPGINGSLQENVDASFSGADLPMCMETNPYTGTFDGRGHHLTLPDTDIKSGTSAGLFKTVGDSGTVKNLSVKINFKAGSEISDGIGIICHTNRGTITGCTSEGSIEAKTGDGNKGAFKAGGICCVNTGTVDSCINEATVRSIKKETDGKYYSYAGGICADNSGTVRNCGNKGKISAHDSTIGEKGAEFFAGGIAAENTGSIINCYNSEEILAQAGTGGYTQREVYSGGITGLNETGGSVYNCFNCGTADAGTNGEYYIGGCIAFSSGYADYMYSTVFRDFENSKTHGEPVDEGECLNEYLYRTDDDGVSTENSVYGQEIFKINLKEEFRFYVKNTDYSSVLNALNGWAGDSEKDPYDLYKTWKMSGENPVLNIE